MAGPLVLSVADLLGDPGERRVVEGEVVLDGLGLSTASVPQGTSVRHHLTLESVAGGLTASGTARAEWTGACRRCLDPVDGTVEAEVDEMFRVAPGDEEFRPIDDGEIDLEPVLREAVLLALPIAPLCGDACRGPAPDAYPTDAVDGDGAAVDAGPDPRWAALDELRFDQ